MSDLEGDEGEPEGLDGAGEGEDQREVVAAEEVGQHQQYDGQDGPVGGVLLFDGGHT